MFDGDMESMPFIDVVNSTMLALPVTFDPASDTTLETGIRTHGIDSVSTSLLLTSTPIGGQSPVTPVRLERSSFIPFWGGGSAPA